MAPQTGITDLLLECRSGGGAVDRVFPMIYEELRRVAHAHLRREQPGHTLVTTDLVHEAYIRLVDLTRVRFRDRVHFLSMAARAMRRILVDHARAHRAARRGAGIRPEPLDEELVAADREADELSALDDALQRLEAVSPRLARVVEYRYFAGMTEEEAAEALGITSRTVRRDWVKARGRLRHLLDDRVERDQ
jgi:RNA polymerase sigma factor (TIGR02999 family)